MRTYYLKTKLTRAALRETFRQHTLLVVKHANNNPNTEKFFSGTVSDEEAWLCNITAKHPLSPYIQVLFRGIEEDMYLIVTPRMYTNAALPLLLSLFCGTSSYLLYRLFVVWKWQSLGMMEFWVLAPILMLLLVFMLLRRRAFLKSRESTLDFIRILCDAEVVKKEDVPGVFLLR
jgi:hypothetical protein